ncbi:hypothetical protein AB0L59_38065 [Streptomyces sp. NPDC052109]|uniref:hypothetical protein n=1 Tax=Streptomyces sp. NPDC052109 TaxID=3155527 RepID=UPI0034297799
MWPAATEIGTLRQGYRGNGMVVEQGLVSRTGAHVHCGSAARHECSTAVGYCNTYRPYSHYWPLQLTTSALLPAVAGLLVLASYLVLRRLTGMLRPAARTTGAPRALVPTGAPV